MDKCSYKKRRGGKFDRFSIDDYPDFDGGSGEEPESNPWGFNQFPGMDASKDYFDYSIFLNDPSLNGMEKFSEESEGIEELEEESMRSLKSKQVESLKHNRGRKKQARFYLKAGC